MTDDADKGAVPYNNIGNAAKVMQRDVEERIEYAARTYCTLRGLDPDEQVADRTLPPHIDTLYLTSRWRNEAHVLSEMKLRLDALRQAGLL